MNLSLTNNERLLKSETHVKRKEKLPTFLGVSKPRFLTRLRAAPRRGRSFQTFLRRGVSTLSISHKVLSKLKTRGHAGGGRDLAVTQGTPPTSKPTPSATRLLPAGPAGQRPKTASSRGSLSQRS